MLLSFRKSLYYISFFILSKLIVIFSELRVRLKFMPVQSPDDFRKSSIVS